MCIENDQDQSRIQDRSQTAAGSDDPLVIFPQGDLSEGTCFKRIRRN